MIARLAGAAGVALALTAGAGSAQDLVKWGSSDFWSVLIDPTLGNGCLIQSEFEDGSTVRISLDRTKGMGYLTVFNAAWGDIEDGATYPISFTLDDETFEGEARGLYLNDVPGADVEFDNEEFFMSLAQRQTMTMFSGGEEVLSIDMTGTGPGLEAVLQCQEEQS